MSFFFFSFEDQHRKLNLWIHEMEERSNTENLGESRHHISEKKNEIHKVEMFLGELLAARYGVEPEQELICPHILDWLVTCLVLG